jgi:hypothetical protein
MVVEIPDAPPVGSVRLQHIIEQRQLGQEGVRLQIQHQVFKFRVAADLPSGFGVYITDVRVR